MKEETTNQRDVAPNHVKPNSMDKDSLVNFNIKFNNRKCLESLWTWRIFVLSHSSFSFGVKILLIQREVKGSLRRFKAVHPSRVKHHDRENWTGFPADAESDYKAKCTSPRTKKRISAKSSLEWLIVKFHSTDLNRNFLADLSVAWWIVRTMQESGDLILHH